MPLTILLSKSNLTTQESVDNNLTGVTEVRATEKYFPLGDGPNTSNSKLPLILSEP